METAVGKRDTQVDTTDQKSRERKLIDLIRELLQELRPRHADTIEISLFSRLDRDLGIDSLGRTELILRIERAFRVRLPVRLMGEVDTVGDIVAALDQARPDRGPLADVTPTITNLPPVPAAAEARTLIEVLEWHVAQHPERHHVTVLQDEITVLASMTYGELATAARAVAAGLIAHDVMPGDRVAIMLPTGVDFFTAFFGVLYAGAVPVPIYPPMQLSQVEDYVRRQAGILSNAEARMLITVPEGLRLGVLMRGMVASVSAIESVASLSEKSVAIALPNLVDSSAIALIQYTSGSTGDPKGVVLSHANLLANIRAIGRAINASSADIFVSWLPLYHDMGLIGAWLGCLYFGAPLYAMSPLSFLARPQSWLWAIHRFRCTISAAPNFAFELCLNKIDDAELAGLDLNALRLVANGAEPVSIDTLRQFIDRFGRHGFRPEAMAPVYGLAENAVAVTLPPLGRAPIIDRVDREALSRGTANPARPDDHNAIEFVACGQPVPDHEVRIVDELGNEVSDRCEGRLEFRGPSATSGYFRNEAKTRELFHNGWLDSGDRAYMSGGDVFITGRIKDIIIRAGQHIYPQEIEEAVGRIPGLLKGGIAVFGLSDAASGTERVIVLAETAESDPSKYEALRRRALDVATNIVGTPPDDIVLVQPGIVPKTSSGKIRRAAAKVLYAKQQFDLPRRALHWQIARLSITGLVTRAARLARTVNEIAYAGWWWTVIGLGVVFGCLAIIILPSLKLRWASVRMFTRVALAAISVPISIRGLHHIPSRCALLVFNHASYMDTIVVASVIPGEPAYVAKRELADQIFAGPMLRRLGVLFVERYDLAGSLADTDKITTAAKHGRSLIFFPEGTFTRRAGLSSFYLGAFKVAAEANLPVLPGIVRGTRTMLRGEQWFPRWTPISVVIGAPIEPSGNDFAAVARLRDAARNVILAGCGEPDLGELVKPAPPLSPKDHL